MSLEKEIAANTEAVQELTAVMKEVAANQAQILKAAKVAPKSDESDEDEVPKKAARRRDEDEDEAPRKKRSRADDDEDEDEKPAKKRSRAADDDEDEAPRKKRAARDDDEDEDEAPRKKRSRDADEDEEEDEKPAKKARSRSDDDEDEKPAKKAASKKSSKDKGPSTATIRAAIADLMSDCDKGEEEDRNDFIEAMFDHLDVANAAEIDEKDFERVLAWIAKKKDGKKVKFD